MHFKFDEEEGRTECWLDNDDKCFMCEACEDCPLLQAIETHLVYPSADLIHIYACPMFEK